MLKIKDMYFKYLYKYYGIKLLFLFMFKYWKYFNIVKYSIKVYKICNR